MKPPTESSARVGLRGATLVPVTLGPVAARGSRRNATASHRATRSHVDEGELVKKIGGRQISGRGRPLSASLTSAALDVASVDQFTRNLPTP